MNLLTEHACITARKRRVTAGIRGGCPAPVLWLTCLSQTSVGTSTCPSLLDSAHLWGWIKPEKLFVCFHGVFFRISAPRFQMQSGSCGHVGAGCPWDGSATQFSLQDPTSAIHNTQLGISLPSRQCSRVGLPASDKRVHLNNKTRLLALLDGIEVETREGLI